MRHHYQKSLITSSLPLAFILAKIRNTVIFNRLYIKLYIKFVANNGKNRDSVHAVISFCPCFPYDGVDAYYTFDFDISYSSS